MVQCWCDHNERRLEWDSQHRRVPGSGPYHRYGRRSADLDRRFGGSERPRRHREPNQPQHAEFRRRCRVRSARPDHCPAGLGNGRCTEPRALSRRHWAPERGGCVQRPRHRRLGGQRSPADCRAISGRWRDLEEPARRLHRRCQHPERRHPGDPGQRQLSGGGERCGRPTGSHLDHKRGGQ